MRFLKTASKNRRLQGAVSDMLTDRPILNGRVEKGKILCRPAFISRPDIPVYCDNGADSDETYPVITDCSVYLFGRLGRVIINVRDNLMGNLIFEMRLVYPEGDSLELGRIEFTRSGSGETGYPSAYTVFSGSPVRGSGIFFTCRQQYSGGSEDFCRIMELSEDLSTWIMLSSDSTYVPTVLANGRGDAWYRAAPYGELLDLPEPVKPQSRNLISDAFYSYFTTDSVSVWYTLPESGLDEAMVSAELYYQGNDYLFEVYPYTDASEGTDIDGTEVVMLVNRERGDICFKSADGRDFALPYGGRLNNLKITAYKNRPDDLLRVCSATGCVGITSSVSTGESEVTVFYGGSLRPADLLWNSPLHPLYFPADSRLSLGDGEAAVDRLILRDKTLYAFKEDRAFLSETVQFKGEDKIFTEDGEAKNTSGYEIAFKKAVSLPARPQKESVCLFGTGVIFADSLGGVYTLKDSVTERVYDTDRVGECRFAVTSGDRYLLFGETDAEVLEKDGKGGFYTYRWSFEENIVGGFSYLGRILLLGLRRRDAEAMLFPVLSGSGGEDSVLSSDLTATDRQIIGSVSLAPFDTPEAKRLYGIFLEGEGEALIEIADGQKSLKKERLTLKRGGGVTALGLTARRPVITLGFKGGFSVESIALCYRIQNRL